MMNVSILIPTYKRPEMVIEAIKSCFDQTYPPFEIIVGDDSPDELTSEAIGKIIKTSPIQIKYIHNKPSLKQTENTNMLFSKAHGDKIMLLHDDDLILPEALESLVQVFETDPTIDIAFGKQYIITAEGEVSIDRSQFFNESFFRTEKYSGSILTSLEASLGQQFPNNGYLMDKKVVKEIKFRNYGFGENLGNGCEYDFGLQIGIAGYKMFFLNKYLAKYRVAPNSMSSSKTGDSGYQSFRILKNLSLDTSLAKEIRSLRLYERAPIAITQAVNIGKRREAFQIFTGKWYRRRILTLKGIKRALYILFAPSYKKT